MAYGDGQELRTQQQAAPMAGRSATSGAQVGGGMGIEVPTVPISAPTQYPDRPITNGQPFGPGAGPEVLATANTGPSREKLMAALPLMMRRAEQPDASPEFRALVGYLRSLL